MKRKNNLLCLIPAALLCRWGLSQFTDKAKRSRRIGTVPPMLWFICVLFAGVFGCSLAPEYKRPEAPVPAAWPGEQTVASAQTEKTESDIPWKDYFVDEKLRQVIALALENNRDLRIAALNMERMQGLYRIKRAELLPSVDATAAGSKQRTLNRSGVAETSEQYSVGLGVVSWELDFFGRIRNLKAMALEQYLAAGETRRAVQIGLVAETAAAWLTLGADLERLAFAKETLENQEAAYRLIERRLDVGASSELDLRQAETRREAARGDVARFTALAAQARNGLDLITGTAVPDDLLPAVLPETLAALKELAPGLPSGVLLRRPDVMAAENMLKGYNANIGAARAAFFPRITLTGSAGIASNDLSDLFSDGSGVFAVAPRISIPLFDTGSGSGNLKAAEADRDMAVARYEKAIQTAFKEVSDALVRRRTIDDEVNAQQALADAADASFKLSTARYDNGVDSYLTVLDSQRSLYSARQGVIAARLVRLLNQATLYKALGGGGE